MMNFIKPRYEHKDALWLWNVIAHEEAVWSKWEGLGFADYYFVQHKIFKKIKRIKCFGYRAKEHPKYQEFYDKYFIYL
jgi:hypothetical protein